MAGDPPLPRDPLANTTSLLVDGTNLLHALTRGSGDRQPPAAVIGRLRAAVPKEAAITLVFDGPAERGVRGERIAGGGLTVRYSGRRTADEVLLDLVNEAATWSEADGPAPPRSSSSPTTVTRSNPPARRPERGDPVADRPARAPTSGTVDRQPRPPKPGRLVQEAKSIDDGDSSCWSPGRGATTKRGNPKRRRSRNDARVATAVASVEQG